jgi:hypothetical protein
MRHSPLQSPKHETFQKLSKLLRFSPFLFFERIFQWIILKIENIFDFIMLVVNLYDFRLETPSPFLRAILILRLLRLFRPPRPFRNGEGLIYHTVVGALFWLLLIGIFAFFLYLIFAIIGMELFLIPSHVCHDRLPHLLHIAPKMVVMLVLARKRISRLHGFFLWFCFCIYSV